MNLKETHIAIYPIVLICLFLITLPGTLSAFTVQPEAAFVLVRHETHVSPKHLSPNR